MEWTLWLKGLAAVAIGGAATGATAVLSAGQLNKNVGITAAIGALSTVLAYLVKSPIAPDSGSTGATAAAPPAQPPAAPSNDTAAQN
jgi:hypothetical protein